MMKPIVEIALSLLLLLLPATLNKPLCLQQQWRDKCHEWQAASATLACGMAPRHAANSRREWQIRVITEDAEKSWSWAETEQRQWFDLKETYDDFFVLFFLSSSVSKFLLHVKVPKVEKPKVSGNRCPPVLQQTLLQECLVGSLSFISVTLWHHTISPCHTPAKHLPILTVGVMLTGS